MKQQTTIRAPAELLDALRREAGERGQSLNHYVWLLIEAGRAALEKAK
jgi:predicted HicB family RNase H-like nuclease